MVARGSRRGERAGPRGLKPRDLRGEIARELLLGQAIGLAQRRHHRPHINRGGDDADGGSVLRMIAAE